MIECLVSVLAQECTFNVTAHPLHKPVARGDGAGEQGQPGEA